ncbi:MAG: TonB-dependent receptor [Flavobacteriaceae bacterium]|nr:TonB-dependent receptor [Flavobacteriaceae bacterium]
MKNKFENNIGLIFILIACQITFAQKKDENIGTEVVNVVKPYTPTISDAFKVKEIPSLEDVDNSKKEDVKYNFFSFPVASTFVPIKGRAAVVEKPQTEKLYKNFANVGLGNYTTLNTELFVTENFSDHEYIGGMFRHLSSQGGIKDVALKNDFSTTSLDLTYGNQLQNLTWISDLGFKNQLYNWYGIPENLSQLLIDRINPKHTFNNLYIGTNLSLTDSFFKDASLKYNRFWDTYGSVENRFYVKPSFEFELLRKKLKTNLIVDYLGGSFDKNFQGTSKIKYGFTNFGIHPSVAVNKNDWAINIGASVFYSANNENSNSKIFVYPQVNASLKVVGDFMIFYTGIEGSLNQNSYCDFSNENPFVSPTLAIAPTDKQFDLFAGIKGKLSNNVSYTLRSTVQNEKNKPLFKTNEFNMFSSNSESYQFGNSFGVVYDYVRTVSLFGELKADFNKNVTIGLNGSYSRFFTTFQEEAWNLPTLILGSNINVNITKKWFAGANLVYVGERKDIVYIQSMITIFPPAYYSETTNIKGYLDANFNIGYNHNEQLTGFIKFNNIANQSYQKWLNYPVQALQVVLGASYKFDF